MHRYLLHCAAILALSLAYPAYAQLTTQRAEPLRDNDCMQLTSTGICISPPAVVQSSVLVLKDGRVATARPAALAERAFQKVRVWSLEGQDRLSGFIDTWRAA